MPDIDPALTIDGMTYRGWTGIEVTRDIERMAGAFQLELTDKWPGIEEMRAVKPGFACRLENAGDILVTGWIDVVDLSIGSSDHTITATGRDKTGDLVDCTAAHAGGSWADQPLRAIAEDLCRPFGVNVIRTADAADEVIKSFKLEDGEKVFDAIERLCRIKGLLATSTPAGQLLLTTSAMATRSGATLKTGKGGNVLSAAAKFDHSQRFSAYTVKGQDAGFGYGDGADAASPKGTAADNGVSRHRPLTVLAEEAVDQAGCSARANWEASVRAGRARRLTATVQGWYYGQFIWRPLTLVDCEIPEVNLAGPMLVSAVTYKRDAENGTTAELTLADPGAFTGLAQPVASDENWGW